jgi:Uma2 family endonuclease
LKRTVLVPCTPLRQDSGSLPISTPCAHQMWLEVISPGDGYTEVEEKIFAWLDAGTKMVVVVNPRQQSVTVYRSQTDITAFTEAGVLDGVDVVPGFELAVREIFA